MESNAGVGGMNSEYDEVQSKVDIMRSLLQKESPTSMEVDDETITRFLHARDLDITKASDLLLKYLRWRKDFMPKGFICVSDIKYQLSQNKVFLQGSNKAGQPVAVVFGSRHTPTKGKESLEEFKRLMAYCLDKICESIPKGQNKFVGILDLQGWGYSNCDISGYGAGISILQDCYPERLSKIYLVHVPFIFLTAWKIISPFIDENSRKKIVFVNNNDLKATLLQDIDEDQLPDIYGGKLPLVPIQDS